MVEQSPRVNLAPLLKDIDHAEAKLKEIAQKRPDISKQELSELMKILKTHVEVDSGSDSTFWEDKKLAPEGKPGEKINIEKALQALGLFKKEIHRNVEQAIVSLYASFNADSQASDSDANLRSLKDLKIGRRVEKTGESSKS